MEERRENRRVQLGGPGQREVGLVTHVCLVACVAGKKPEVTAAKDLYTSPLFKKCRALAESRFDRWYVLSAEYGLVEPNRKIAPYDKTLTSMLADEREAWAGRVLRALAPLVKPGDSLTFLAGHRYREGLVTPLREAGYKVTVPLEGMGIGKQLSWLDRQLAGGTDVQRARHLDQFYELLSELQHRLGGRRLLGGCTGKNSWPNRGVYFFFEPGEYRAGGDSRPRVVRVGTHAIGTGAKSKLWDRLRFHRGHRDGGGNHRGSIFRLHVGMALIKRSKGKIDIPTWGQGQSASKKVLTTERDHEVRVSNYLGRMSLLWLAVEDEPGPQSARAYLERNSIGLLAGPDGPLDRPSSKWLGRHSPHDTIRESGLWNVNHVEQEYEPDFLVRLAEYVDQTERE
jgi:hypothetical protein